jgi:hypothetical protein
MAGKLAFKQGFKKEFILTQRKYVAYDNSDMASEPAIRHSCKCLAGFPPLSTHTGQSRVIFECSTTTTTYCYSIDLLNIVSNIDSSHINYVPDSVFQTKNFSDARSPETKSPT